MPTPIQKSPFLQEFSGKIAFPTPTTRTQNPKLIAFAPAFSELETLCNWDEVFSGNFNIESHPDLQPFTTRYGGHQFGHWAGQLGDGRAHLLGVLQTERFPTLEVQIKGAGLTPFSRRGDGRAVLRSSLREFICSEAMHYLNVPTTRAIALYQTGDQVIRDLFYDGNPKPEPGAIVVRASQSFLRFGHFQILLADQNFDELKRLWLWTAQNLYPHCVTSDPDETLIRSFEQILNRTAHLMVEWCRVGFVHGVMNTDNMSILGETIDYGPFGWLDVDDPDFTPNTTDYREGRYRFSNQPQIAYWNLARLSETLIPLLESDEKLISVLKSYEKVFRELYLSMMARKLGLSHGDHNSVLTILPLLEKAMRINDTDPTLFYRCLYQRALKKQKNESVETFCSRFIYPEVQNWNPETVSNWSVFLENWGALTKDSPRLEAMKNANPVFIPRNYVLSEIIEELEKKGTQKLKHLMTAMITPYEENEFTLSYFKKRPDWAKSKPGCSALSCSS